MKRFADQVAFITGGARGIGRATAERLADEGATVVLGDVDGKALEVTSRQMGAIAAHRNVDTVIIDVSDAAAVEQTARDLIKRHGRLDVLVNNAGILRDNWIDCLTDDDWQAVIGVHLTGAFNCTRSVVPHMKERGYGRVVNVSSRAWMGNPGQSNYSAAKAGLVGLTRSLALELARFGVNVNAVAPGMIDTDMTRSLRQDVFARLVAAQPGGRAGTAEEVAAAVAFLASPEASFVTGQVLAVCGGKSLGMAGVA